MSVIGQELIKLTCNTKKTLITVYADLLAYGNGALMAARYAGEPQQVQAMADCMSAGTVITAEGYEKLELICKSKEKSVKYVSGSSKYAECLYFLKNDLLQSSSVKRDGEKETVESKRNIYFFCRRKEELFSELDRQISVPLIPDFEEYFLSEIQKRGILHEMTVISPYFPFYGWYLTVSNDEHELAEILNEGLKNGIIQIPGGCSGMNGTLQNMATFTEYLKEFGVQIADKIKRRFRPIYDPAEEQVCQEVLEVNSHVISNAGYSLFDAQLGTAEALKRQLDRDRLALLIAECGSGKTKIGAAALYAHQHAHGNTDKHFNVICCPSHICEKWVREIAETLPNSFAAVVRSITDVNNLYRWYQEHEQDVYCVLSKEQARDGPMHYPAVVWSQRKKAFVCTECGCEITHREYGVPIRVNANFFLNENSRNHKCPNCDKPLWSICNPYDVRLNEWVRIGGYGYVHRKFAVRDFDGTKDKVIREKIRNVLDHPNEYIPAIGACRKYPLSAYIKRRIPKVDGVIIDELHQYSGESAQGQAIAEVAQKADKVIGMTATLLNGYAKGLFYLLFRLKPRLMLMDNQKYEKSHDFCAQYGVIEHTLTVEKQAFFNVKSRGQKSMLREKMKPGISPLVYCRFLLENAAFLSLNDMGKELPEYEELPLVCAMPQTVTAAYEEMEGKLKTILRKDRLLGNRLLSAYLNLLSAYPDQPYNHEPIYNPFSEDGEIILQPPDTAAAGDILPKDEEVLKLLDRKVRTGERVIIYTAWTRLDTRDKLQKLLTEKGYRVHILDTNIPAQKREKWVDDKVRNGIDVLIVNPALVETGLDLNAFTTLVFYNITYNLYVFRQASRRSWRINQTAPRIEVYMLCYSDTMQERALKLMASKLMAATVIEGNISDEGLAAMSSCEDMASELARQLVSGIKDEVDDLSDSFKKMAILHPERTEELSLKEAAQEADSIQPISTPLTILNVHLEQEEPINAEVMVFSSVQRSRKKVLQNFDETGQVSLFDLLAS